MAHAAGQIKAAYGGQREVREGEEVKMVEGSKRFCCIPRDEGGVRMYLTF